MSGGKKKSLKNAAEKATKKTVKKPAKKPDGTSTKSSGSQTAGKKIGKYQNAVLLAKGGMGAIYKADHPTLDQPVVLKMLTLTGSDQFTQRFQREATIMMGFQHVNIVNYFDHFKTTHSYCMVMEYVDGCSLAQLLEKHRYLDDDIALLVLRDTLRALDFAHAKGVIHRDIKPANILISSTGEVKLTDFGIAHDQGVDTDGLTREGMTLGTPSYMAPEQFRDAGTVDARADIYSAGVLLYESLTGGKPFSGGSLPEMLERIRKGRYDRLAKLRPESTRLSRRLVHRAMKPRPGGRYKDASRMLRQVESFISRRGEENLRSQLSDLVAGKSRKHSGGGKRRRQIYRISLTVLAGLAAAAILFGAWIWASLAGLSPGWALPGFTGAVTLELALPEEQIQPPGVFLEVMKTDADYNGPDVLSRREGHLREDGRVIRTIPILLKPGLYSCAVHIGDEVHIQGLRVPSLKDRRLAMNDSSSPAIRITPDWKPESRPLIVRWDIRDSENGKTLSEARLGAIGGFDGRIPSGNSMQLESGGYYEFSFVAPGYTDRIVSLTKT